MGYVVVLLLIYFYMIRDIASYHPKLVFNKYIVFKNKVLSKLLISSKVDKKCDKVPLKDQNKCLYAGVIFYVGWFILLLFSVIMLKVVPSIPLDYNMLINTVNMRIVISLVYIFGMAIVAFWLINRYPINDTKPNKVLSVFISCFMVCGIIVNLLVAFGVY